MKNQAKNHLVIFLIFLLCGFIPLNSYSTDYYTIGAGGNWSSTAIWSLSCNGVSAGAIPGAGDNVFICNNGGALVTITVDGNYSCSNLTIGDAISNATTIQITSSSNSLTIGGALSINPSNNANTYVLDAGPGTINVNGTFPTWGTAGTNNIKVSTGTIIFVPLVTINNAAKIITFTSTGTINFNAGFTSNQNPAVNFITVTGCTAIFEGTLTWTLGGNWGLSSTSTAVFKGTTTNISTSGGGLNLGLGNVVIYDGATVSTAGNSELSISGNLTLNTSATFITTKRINGLFTNVGTNDVTLNSGSNMFLGNYIVVKGNWINNGESTALHAGTYTVIFDGYAKSIGGNSSTTFYDLQIGYGTNYSVSYSLDRNITCNNLIFNSHVSGAYSRTLTHSASNALTVTGNVTINQPNADATTNLWNIAAGSATIAGNMIFSGTSNTISRVTKVNITDGSLSLTGNITWMTGQATPQEVATEIISLVTGTVTLSNSLTMAQGSGTFNITGTGIVNFNGAATPSFNLNSTVASNTINAVFTNAAGSTINFNNGFTNANTAVTFADGSNAVFTGTGTITPTAAITFGNFQINASPTVSLAGNISITNNWTNLGGTFSPGTNTVSFSGMASQTISKTGGETFYGLTSNTIGPIILSSDVMITNTLNMTAGNYYLNGKTLTLGSSAGATLVRTGTTTTNIMYGTGGVFKRWFPVGAISSTGGPLYGFFPMGTSTDLSQIEINSTVDPTIAGYVSATHTEALTVTDVSYTDNESDPIQRIHDTKAIISSIGSLAGGTYNLDITFTILSSTGNLLDVKLETFTGSVMGSVGTSAITGGVINAPIVKRTLLNATDLVNDWVLGTKDKTTTPLRAYYYSITTGNWASVGVWSFTNGGPSCGCIPANDGFVIITSLGTPVSINSPATVDFLDINSGAILNGTSNLTINYDLTTYGTGVFVPTTGNYTVGRNVILNGTGSSNTPSGTTIIASDLTVSSGTVLTLGAGLIVSGNFIVNGTFIAGANNITLDGVAKNISGTATISGNGTITLTNSKSILSGTNLTINLTLDISAATTVTNNGTITLNSNLTGANSTTSVWTNAANSVLNATGSVLTSGSGGILNASALPNTVNYNSNGSQTIKGPSTSYYNLSCSNAGTKSLSVNPTTVSNAVLIQDAAILSETSAGCGGSDCDLEGSAGVSMTGANTQFLIYESASVTLPELSGTYSLPAGTVLISMTTTGGILRGAGYNNLTIAGNAPPNAGQLNNVTNNLTWSNSGGGVALGNNLTVGGIYNHTAGGVILGSNIIVGNFTQSGGTVNAGSYTFNVNNNISGTAWSRSGGTFTSGTSTVVFNGNMAQTIGGTASTTFYNLKINNSSTTGVTLSKSTTVGNGTAGTLILTDGNIFTDIVNILTMDAGSSVSPVGGSATSFVDGPIVKTGTTGFVFPTGDGVKWRRIEIGAPSVSETFTAEYVNAAYSDTTTVGPDRLHHISIFEYWNLARAGAGNATVKLYWEDAGASGITDFSDLRLAHYNNSDWDNLHEGLLSITGTCCGTNSGTIATTDYVTSFSPFTFGSKTGINPLPVTWLSIDAVTVDSKVDVIWITASENNNDYFTVQRSTDATNFSDLCIIDGAGNSNEEKIYNVQDSTPYSGVSYYRVKQTDYNGNFSFSRAVSVNFEGIEIISTYPNPAYEQVSFLVNTFEETYISFSIYNITGSVVASDRKLLKKGVNTITYNVSSLSSMVYILKAATDDNKYSDKVIFMKSNK